jgi:hypothetical protein
MIVRFSLWKLFQLDYIVNSTYILFIYLISIFSFFRSNGLETVIGCHQQTLQDPPPIGSVLTVKHVDYHQNGVLRHPFYWRLSFDLSWQDISLYNKNLV